MSFQINLNSFFSSFTSTNNRAGNTGAAYRHWLYLPISNIDYRVALVVSLSSLWS